ncbi:MAG: oligosaccharide repeat unit polymerase [Solobacterium sp.]|nr:oligosaccharide repeat unit polymerase [Solobacterium sp.]MCH4049500.1 oligosaccharide repeat unit polymerase [Solobacterium sp.]MCH4075358.1 oligosaccharide repeat unit polymerase [Solobacterium sp.]
MTITLSIISVYLTWIYVFFKKKNYLHVITFITWGIFFPLALYQLNWSNLIETANNGVFSYLIVTIAIISIVFTFSTLDLRPKKISLNEKIRITRFGKNSFLFLNLLFVSLYLLENYMGSGSLIPGLVGIDIHNKYSAPLISYITNSSFLFVSFDYLCYKATKRKYYLLWMILIISIPVITRSSRMVMVISIVQLLCLYALFEKEKRQMIKKEKKQSRRRNLAIAVVIIATAIFLMAFTNYRMSHYGIYDITYQQITGWSGPSWLTWMAPFYGYFALSFNNLKINIMRRHITHNYLGIYSFASFYFGLLQIDNIFGIPGSGQTKGNYITNGAANVPTGFWDFYYDYGVFFFIPFIIALLILLYFLKRASKNNRLQFKVLYCWYVTYFAFMSFQNTLFMSTSLIGAFLIYFVIKRSFTVIKID